MTQVSATLCATQNEALILWQQSYIIHRSCSHKGTENLGRLFEVMGLECAGCVNW